MSAALSNGTDPESATVPLPAIPPGGTAQAVIHIPFKPSTPDLGKKATLTVDVGGTVTEDYGGENNNAKQFPSCPF